MKVGEARGIYNSVLKSYNEQKLKVSQQMTKLNEQMQAAPDTASLYEDEAATLELTYNALSEKEDEYQDYMDKLMEQFNGTMELESAKQNADAMEEYGIELGKIMAVARRIMHGDRVPATDEKKLLEFDADLYAMAKNAGMMADIKKRKEYDSLWDDEEKEEVEDPMTIANNEEAASSGPEVVSAESVVASVTGGGVASND